jgi:ABC-type glycerol-3-phosphate transport system permease component
LWSLVVICDQARMPLSLELQLLQSPLVGQQTDYSVIMVATLVSVPAIIVFLLMQRRFILGLLSGAVKS